MILRLRTNLRFVGMAIVILSLAACSEEEITTCIQTCQQNGLNNCSNTCESCAEREYSTCMDACYVTGGNPFSQCNPFCSQCANPTTADLDLIQNDSFFIGNPPGTQPFGSRTSFQYGETISYTTSYLNRGPGTAYNVVVTHSIPEGLTLRTGAPYTSPQCYQQGSSVLCTWFSANRSLSTAPSQTISFNTPSAPTPCVPRTIVMNATVTAATPDPVPDNNARSSTITLTCPPAADLSVTQTGPTQKFIREIVAYTFTISNAGPDIATNVNLRIPAATYAQGALNIRIPYRSFVTPPLPCAIQNDTNGFFVGCAGITLAPGASRSFTVEYATPNETCPSPDRLVTSNATVTASQSDPNSSNNQTSLQTTLICPSIDLAIQQIHTGALTVYPDDIVTYKFNITNNGRGPGSGPFENRPPIFDPPSAHLVNPIPKLFFTPGIGREIDFYPQRSDPTCNIESDFAGDPNRDIGCSINNLPAGQTMPLSVSFKMPAQSDCDGDATVLFPFTNYGVASFNIWNESGNTHATSQNVVVNLRCGSSDLSIAKTGPATVSAGDLLSYSVTVTNNGPRQNANYTVTDIAPKRSNGVALVFNAAQSDPNCDDSADGNTVTCRNIGGVPLAAGASRTFIIAFNTPAVCTPQNFINQASVSTPYNADPNSSNNQSTTVTTQFVCPPASSSSANSSSSSSSPSVDATVTHSVSPSPLTKNVTAVYTVNVRNNGPSQGQDTFLSFEIPDEPLGTSPQGIPLNSITFNAALSDSSCKSNGSVVSCLRDDTVAANGTATFNVAYNMPSSCTNSTSIRSYVRGGFTQPNPDLNQSDNVHIILTPFTCPPASSSAASSTSTETVSSSSSSSSEASSFTGAGCGDGVLQANEECDAGSRNGQIDTFCNLDCKSLVLACYEKQCGCFSMNHAATTVIGHISDRSEYTPDFGENIPNDDHTVSDIGFRSPTDIVIDAKHHLAFVADKRNNRVLVYQLTNRNDFPDQRADFVLGQPDFKTNDAGVSITDDSYMKYPSALAIDIDRNRLFVADTGNNRVLVFAGISASRFAQRRTPDFVLGQPDFDTLPQGITALNNVTDSNMYMPRGIAYSRLGYLYVSDTSRSRVLRFDIRKEIYNGKSAETLLGQSDFDRMTTGSAENQFNFPRGLLVDGGYIFVSDTQNNRVVIFRESALKTPVEFGVGNMPVSIIGLGIGTSAQMLRAPQNLAANANYIFISDSYNNRVLAYKKRVGTPPFDIVPAFALGQPNFASNALQYEPTGERVPTDRALRYPLGLAFVQDSCSLFVVDNGYNRILQYENDGSCLPPVETPGGGSEPVICNLDGVCQHQSGENCVCEDCQEDCSGNDYCDMTTPPSCIANDVNSSSSLTVDPPVSSQSASASSESLSSAQGGGGDNGCGGMSPDDNC